MEKAKEEKRLEVEEAREAKRLEVEKAKEEKRLEVEEAREAKRLELEERKLRLDAKRDVLQLMVAGLKQGISIEQIKDLVKFAASQDF